MGKINSGRSSPKGRLSSQTRTTKRTGRISQQKQRITVAVRRQIKSKKINREVGWLW